MVDNFHENTMNIEEIARSFYNPRLEYHNFNHALEVWNSAREIIMRCRQDGKPVNERVVYYACLFHDAGYHEDEKEKGFQSKEAYAAFLAERELSKFGVKQSLVEQAVAAILGTEMNRDISDLSIEAMVVRAADLAGFAREYEVFLDNNRKLKSEEERINQNPISPEEWKMKTKKAAEHYLSQEIRLGGGYEDEKGESVFHKKTKENLDRFLK